MVEIGSTETISVLPVEFVRRIEKDLNNISQAIPDYFANNYDELKEVWNYPNVLEFLIGWCVGNCQGSYAATFQQVYDKAPSIEQISAIHKIISRRRLQIEQGVSAFLEENNIK